MHMYVGIACGDDMPRGKQDSGDAQLYMGGISQFQPLSGLVAMSQ